MESKYIFAQLYNKYYRLIINSVIYSFNENGELSHYNSSYMITKLSDNGFEVREVVHCDEEGNTFVKNEVFFDGYHVYALNDEDKIIDVEIDMTRNDAYHKALELFKNCKFLIEGRVYDDMIDNEFGLYFRSDFTGQKFGVHSFVYDKSGHICMIPKNNISKQIPILIVKNNDVKSSLDL